MANHKKKQHKIRGKEIFEYVWGFKKSFIKDYSDKEIFKKEIHRKGIERFYQDG